MPQYDKNSVIASGFVKSAWQSRVIAKTQTFILPLLSEQTQFLSSLRASA